MITSARLDNDLLMACVSLRRSPVAPDWLMRSEPARSIKLSTPSHFSSVRLLLPTRRSEKTLWLREERSFI